MDTRTITKPNKARIVGPKRVRTDNAAGATKAMADAASALPSVPAHIKLRACERPFWDAIIRARSRDEWGRVELVLAAQLAGIQADVEEGRRLVASGDRDKMEEQGYPSVKAVRANIGALLQQQVMLMRALRIVGNVAGDPGQELPRRQAEREAEQTIARLKHGAKADAVDEPPLLSL